MNNKLDLKKLRQSCKMSQEYLAEKLGISRPTLIKIEKGDRPLTLAERSRVEEIFSLVEFQDRQARAGLDMRVSIPEKNLEKFKQVLLYVLQKTAGKPNVGMTALYKILYFIDFDYYEKYEKQLMGLTYIKNHFGPTPKEFFKVIERMKSDQEIEEVKSRYFKYEQKKFLPLLEPDLSKISGQELELIDDVLVKLSDKTAKELSDYSHRDVPWLGSEDQDEIDYEAVFCRTPEFSVRNYEKND